MHEIISVFRLIFIWLASEKNRIPKKHIERQLTGLKYADLQLTKKNWKLFIKSNSNYFPTIFSLIYFHFKHDLHIW